MVNQAARNKKKKAKKQAAARQQTDTGTTDAEQDAYLAAAHAQAQLERERLALEQQRRQALVEAAAAAEFQAAGQHQHQHGAGLGQQQHRQLQHGSYHVAPDGTVYDENGELMEDEDELDEEDDEDLDDEDEDDEDELDDDDDLLDEDEELRIEVDHQVLQEHQRYVRQQQQQSQQSAARSRQASSNPQSAAATHEALLGTANDLYKQIENAAAAALSGAHGAAANQHQRGSFTFPPSPGGGPGGGAAAGPNAGEEDDAYWLSLPSHLRSFIRSALPLAAGLSTSPQPQNSNNQSSRDGLPTPQQINLTPDQMAAAAAQLAQVVQNGWASTLAKEPLDSPLRSALLSAQQQQQQQSQANGQRGSNTTTTTTTIPLGAFALPLHPHPDSPEAAAAFQAAAQAAAQAAVSGGNPNGGQNGSQQSANLPFPSLANLQASLMQLAKMPPGDLVNHPGFPGNPFTAPTSPPAMQPGAGLPSESKSSKKKKKKAAAAAAAAAAAPPPSVAMPAPQPPAPVPPMQQPIPDRQYAPLRASKITPGNAKPPSPVNVKAPSPVNAKAPAQAPARVATPNNGKQPATQQAPPPSAGNGKSVTNGKQPAVAPAPVRSDSGKGRQIPIQNTAPSATSPQQQQQQQYQQTQTGIRPTPSAVANGKRPLVATRSAVPVVPSAPAKSVTGNTINNPPAPPPVAQPPHEKEPSANAAGKKKATKQESAPAPTTASTAYGGGPTASSSTSSGERAKIRDFWLGLSERDRRDLVKVEKDAVLKKMKEQQRHGCTCAVCVRKRQAIEVELEVLYDAYYDELESYAHHQKAYENSKGMDPKIPPPIGPGPFPGSVDIEKMVSSPVSPAPAAGGGGKNMTQTAKKSSNANTANNSPVKGKTQPPPPPSSNNTANKNAASNTTNNNTNTQSKDKHSHSPSCPHYPHTHDHKHHHHHTAPSSKDRGKATQTAPPPVAGRKHHHHHHHHRDDDEDYVSDEDEYDDEDDDGEYDDEDDYDGEDDIPETDEEDMPPLEGMDSGDEAPPQPPISNPPRRGAHPPVSQQRRNAAPPPKTAPPPAPVAKKGAAAAGAAQNAGSDFFGFGSSLTVKGILTVAEDLLKNDGQKFLEMMESLADKRIQRERAAADGFSESEYEDDEDDEEYDDEEEGDEEDDDELDDEDGEGVEEPLTEEQKMEEGRRMFQVFAARMFEQRVLTAYREKVAQERQMQLLRELEEEDRQAAEREAKKAKDAQKKKDKKKLAKQQKDQERLQAEADRLAAEAAAKAEAEAKAEEERKRAEELRIKREAERKAKEAEALRKEELKRARIAEEARKKKEKEERAREAKLQREKEEAERRAQKEKEEAERRARREEQERKERAAREAKEKEAAAKKAQADKEKAEREKQEKEAAAKAALAASRASPVTIRQTQGQPPRSVSGKVIPGLPKPPAPPTPSPAPAVQASGNKDQSLPAQTAVSPSGTNGTSQGPPSMHSAQQKPGQLPTQRNFSNSFVSGLSATSPMAGRPTFGNATFSQQAPAGFSSSPHAYPQTSFGTIDAVSPNQAQRPAAGVPPGIGNRIVSPMQQHQQQQQPTFGGPPGMQMAGSVSPLAPQRSPYTSFGAAGAQSSIHPGSGSPFASARSQPNGMSSALSPGANNAPLSHGAAQPVPIGRGQPPANRASPGSGHAGSASLNNSSFQHSASGLAALNMDSQVVQRPGFAPSSQQNQSSMPHTAAPSAAPGHARKASQSGVNPIGRPASRFGSEAGSFGAMGMSDFLSSTDEDPAGTSASSLRSISPPPAVLGSGALLDDMMEEEGLDMAPDMVSPSVSARPSISQSSSSFFGNSVFGPPAHSAAADDVWASTPASSSHDAPSKGAGWNSGPQASQMGQQGYGGHLFQAAPAPVIPDRGSVIRDRAKIAFTQLDTAYSSQPAGRQPNYPIGDVYRVFLALYPDSASVDVREFLESCLVPGTVINGNGTFSFQQQGQVLLMNYEATKNDDSFARFGSAQAVEPIGAR